MLVTIGCLGKIAAKLVYNPAMGPQDGIEKKIAHAEDRFREYRARLLGDPAVLELLGRVRLAVRAARQVRAEAGIERMCAECETREGGSCCGAGLEDKYDARLLLINRLLGVELPRRREVARSCWFLGERGCRLQARHVICVNYICRKIEKGVEAGRMREIREREGVELAVIFRLHQRVTELLQKYDRLSAALTFVCDFFDRRKAGQTGPHGFRRSTDLNTLRPGFKRLSDAGTLCADRTHFLELGCADGRVNLLAGYLVKSSVGIELEDWILDEHESLRVELEAGLAGKGLLPVPGNISLFLGDAEGSEVYGRIRARTGLAFEDFDVFYTYLWMQAEYARMIAERAKPGAILLVYGPDRFRLELEGLRLVEALSSADDKLAVYRKPD
jgi:hypothetical protein